MGSGALVRDLCSSSSLLTVGRVSPSKSADCWVVNVVDCGATVDVSVSALHKRPQQP